MVRDLPRLVFFDMSLFFFFTFCSLLLCCDFAILIRFCCGLYDLDTPWLRFGYALVTLYMICTICTSCTSC
ncbi:hypothetical protein BZA77DRAFT_323895 [Pyronema omphalodes]|nr:hypothetical protein BZA77DRAFT_323895 [Pyronema omphalodes]